MNDLNRSAHAASLRPGPMTAWRSETRDTLLYLSDIITGAVAIRDKTIVAVPPADACGAITAFDDVPH